MSEKVTLRIVIRFTNTKTIIQLVDKGMQGDLLVCEATSCDFKSFGLICGLSNVPCAYLTALSLAVKFRKKLGIGPNIHPEDLPYNFYVDYDKHKSITSQMSSAIVRGLVEGQLIEPPSTIRPIDDSIIFGETLAQYMIHLKTTNQTQYRKQFSQYEAHGIDPSTLPSLFHSLHDMILS